MAQYSPKMLAALRHAYEKTDQPMRLIANEFGIGITTLQTLVEKNGWAKRSQRMRGHPPEMGVLEKARKLEEEMRAAALCRPSGQAASAAATTSGEEAADATVPSADADRRPAAPSPSNVDLLDAEVRHEIELLQAERARAAGEPRKRGESESLARRLSNLTQAVQRIERMRRGQFDDPPLSADSHEYDDDIPEDIDEFRLALARRIEAFVASREDEEDDPEDCVAPVVDEA